MHGASEIFIKWAAQYDNGGWKLGVEFYIKNEAEEFYQSKNMPFGSLHIDVPLALDTELALLSEAGFNSISVDKRWTKTTLIKAIK